MRTILKTVVSAIAVSLIAGCHNVQHKDGGMSEMVCKFTDLDSIPIRSFELVGQLEAKSQFGMPTEIRLVNPETLAILDSRAGRQVKLYNLKSDEMAAVLPHGHGPGEMIAACSMSVRDGKVYVGGINDNKICIIDSVDSDAPVVRQVCTADFAFLNILPVEEDKLLTLPLVPERIRFFELDVSNGTKKECGSFPVDDANANNAVFQADLTISPDHKTIVAVNRSWGVIEILNADDCSASAVIRCPDEIQPKLKKIETPNGTRYVQTPMGIALAGVSAAEHGFYTGYVGSRMDKPETEDRRISKVIYFNYDGSGGKFYSLPTEVSSFCIDHDTNTLYGLVCSKDGNVSVVSCHLP